MKKLLSKFSLLLCVLLLISCSGGGDDDSVDSPSDYIDLYLSDTELFIGQSVVLSAFSSSGQIITSTTEFYINSNKIPSNTYNFTQTGSYDVSAKYNGLTSETKTVSVYPTPIEFKKNVWVEDFTGAWCRWCPRVSWAIDLLKAQDADVIFLGVHYGDQMDLGSVERTLRQFFGISSWPSAIIGRQERWSNNVNNLSQVTNEIGKKAYSSVAMESSIDGRTVSVKVKLHMGYAYENIRLGLYLLEDGLVYNQINSTPYYPEITRQGVWSDGSTDVIAFGFIHNDVLRHTFSNIFGDVVSGNNVGHDKVYTKEFQYSIPPNMKLENLKLVAFAADYEDRYIINSRESKIGETQDFEPID